MWVSNACHPPCIHVMQPILCRQKTRKFSLNTCCSCLVTDRNTTYVIQTIGHVVQRAKANNVFDYVQINHDAQI